MSQLCPELSIKLGNLKELQRQFNQELSNLPSTGKPEYLILARDIKNKLEQQVNLAQEAWRRVEKTYLYFKELESVEKKKNYHEVKSFKIDDGNIYALQVLPDGRIVCGTENTVTICQPDQQGDYQVKVLKNKVFEKRSGTNYKLQVLPDGQIVSGGQYGIINIWTLDQQGGYQNQTFRGFYNKHAVCWVTCLQVFSDGRIIAGSATTEIKLWQPDAEGKFLLDADGQPNQHIHSSYDDEWPDELKILTNNQVVSLHKMRNDDTMIKIWQMDDKGNYVELKEQRSNFKQDFLSFSGHIDSRNASLKSSQIMSDGQVIIGNRTGEILFKESKISKSKIIKCFDEKPVECLQILPDNRIVASGDDKIKILEPDKQGDYQEAEQFTSTDCMFQMLADGKIVTAGKDGIVRIWDGEKVN